jgi:cysteinyl-tRNA synthetase
LAAIFDLVRDANTAMDRGEFHAAGVAPVLDALARFDRIFAVLEDCDGERLHALGYAAESDPTSDADVERLIAERQAARGRRDFAAADQIRQALLGRGIILEDTREGGIRWKRK